MTRNKISRKKLIIFFSSASFLGTVSCSPEQKRLDSKIHYAIKNGNQAAAKTFLWDPLESSQALITLDTFEQMSLIQLAAICNLKNTIELLAHQGVDIDQKFDGASPLAFSLQFGNYEAAQKLIEEGASLEESQAILNAAYAGKPFTRDLRNYHKTLRFLLARGCNIMRPSKIIRNEILDALKDQHNNWSREKIIEIVTSNSQWTLRQWEKSLPAEVLHIINSVKIKRD